MLARFLSSPDNDGTFDYFSNILTLLNCEEADSADVYAALTWEIGTPIDRRTLTIRSLIYHEITHFLDLHTTMWGHQYVYRKLNFVQSLISVSADTKDKLEVFAIETGEIDIHKELVQVGNVAPRECGRLTHSIRHEEKFGIVLLIKYCIGDTVHHEVPLSTLSLLEAHATANELLSRLEYASSLRTDPIEAAVIKRETADIFDALLNDTSRLEYSVLLNLAKIHFTELSLASLMSFVAILSRFSLNVTFQALGIIANRIEESFQNGHLGHYLSMELRREAQRALIFFKTILFMYEWKESLNQEAKNRYLSLLESDPLAAIIEMWINHKGMDAKVFEDNYDFLLKMLLDMIEKCKTPLFDANITIENTENKNTIAKRPIGAVALSKLKLINIALHDGTVIKVPNSISFDIIRYFDDNMKLFSKMEQEYNNNKTSRIHMPPDTIEFLIT